MISVRVTVGTTSVYDVAFNEGNHSIWGLLVILCLPSIPNANDVGMFSLCVLICFDHFKLLLSYAYSSPLHCLV